MSYSFGIRSYFAPKDDIQSEILKEVNAARKSIFIMIYAFHLLPLTQTLIKKHKEKVDVRCILDFSQSKGKSEKVEVQKLLRAGVDLAVGTSPKARQIMHEKGMCIDGYHTLTGSYNFTLSAAKQVNHMDFIYSRDRAEWFTSFFKNLKTWILKNEPQKQLKR